LNGQTTAFDLGLGRMLSTKKDFIGRAMAARPALNHEDRLQLVGLKPVNVGDAIKAGAHLVTLGLPPSPGTGQGHVTSAAHSPVLGHSIALALVRGGLKRMGERFDLFDPVRGPSLPVVACHPVFVDPEGAKLRV
ncbi:MAG: sarcosine oxidase subunit alpha, partial [Hyphomicrobiaceae bacterium]|nr:sarcosine oxidase subunit alpha [Hyphomicrobiaceae bacterium]